MYLFGIEPFFILHIRLWYVVINIIHYDNEKVDLYYQ